MEYRLTIRDRGSAADERQRKAKVLAVIAECRFELVEIEWRRDEPEEEKRAVH